MRNLSILHEKSDNFLQKGGKFVSFFLLFSVLFTILFNRNWGNSEARQKKFWPGSISHSRINFISVIRIWQWNLFPLPHTYVHTDRQRASMCLKRIDGRWIVLRFIWTYQRRSKLDVYEDSKKIPLQYLAWRTRGSVKAFYIFSSQVFISAFFIRKKTYFSFPISWVCVVGVYEARDGLFKRSEWPFSQTRRKERQWAAAW